MSSINTKAEEQKMAHKEVIIRTATWSKDSHGLFDYESQHMIRKNLKATSSGLIVRGGNDVKFIPGQDASHFLGASDTLPLMQLDFHNGVYTVSTASKTSIYEDANDKLWLSVRNCPNDTPNFNSYHLSKGDIIKLGRVKLRIKEFYLNGISFPTTEKLEEFPTDFNEFNDCPKDESDQCRICYSSASTAENPLIAPCKCTGSMKFIHFQCVKVWLEHHLTYQHTPAIASYYWKSFECEICRSLYPFNLRHSGIKYPLACIKTPEKGSFIVLESLNKDKAAARAVHVLRPDVGKTIFKIGRGHESDIRIADISVSRLHAQLKVSESSVFLEDTGSKFGTLVLMKHGIQLKPELPKSLQVGRTLLWCCLKSANPLSEKLPQKEIVSETAGSEGSEDDEDESENEEEEHPPMILVEPEQMQLLMAEQNVVQNENQHLEAPEPPRQPYSTGHITENYRPSLQ